MKISEDDITPNLIPYCDDNGCFGVCVRTIMKYNLLPNIINNKKMSSFINPSISNHIVQI